MRKFLMVSSLSFLLSAVSAAHAQQQGGPGGGGPGGGGPGMGGPGGPDGGPPDPEQMRAMMDTRIKKAMSVSDDAWATLQPLIDKVEDLEHQSDTGPMMHGPPHPDDDGDDHDGPGGDDDDHPHSPVETAISNLKKVLADKSSTDDAVQTAMTAVEDAEKKVKEQLVAARKELKAAVTLRQQATLVALGVLD